MTIDATSHAAVSVVNALPLGIGAAIGIAWPARVSAFVARGTRPYRRPRVEPASASTPVVRAAIDAAIERFGPAPSRLRLVVRSTIPIAKGLKSSSAVAGAVASATARACGTAPQPGAVARLAAAAGRRAGVSATGAFDDALAGLEGGGVVTDNRRDVCLRRLELRAGLGAVLWIPEGSHPRAPSLVRAFGRRRGLARRAVDAAMDGDWPEAMALNSRLVEEVMGYRYDGLHRAAKAAGAIASGVSGLGPAFAAVAPLARLPRLRRALPSLGGRRRTVGLLSRLPGTVREA